MYRVYVITSSDSASRGEREDLSGPEIKRMLDEFDTAREVIAGVRNIRNTRNLSPKEMLEVSYIAKDERFQIAAG